MAWSCPLCGLDPDKGVTRARQRDDTRRGGDIEWVLADAASMSWDREFDLAVMTGHAFQELVLDEVVRASLTAVHDALDEGGRFVFETRDPRGRPWQRWDGMSFTETNPEDGGVVTVTYKFST